MQNTGILHVLNLEVPVNNDRMKVEFFIERDLYEQLVLKAKQSDRSLAAQVRYILKKSKVK